MAKFMVRIVEERQVCYTQKRNEDMRLPPRKALRVGFGRAMCVLSRTCPREKQGHEMGRWNLQPVFLGRWVAHARPRLSSTVGLCTPQSSSGLSLFICPKHAIVEIRAM